jgi:hypothetical protein
MASSVRASWPRVTRVEERVYPVAVGRRARRAVCQLWLGDG